MCNVDTFLLDEEVPLSDLLPRVVVVVAIEPCIDIDGGVNEL